MYTIAVCGYASALKTKTTLDNPLPTLSGGRALSMSIHQHSFIFFSRPRASDFNSRDTSRLDISYTRIGHQCLNVSDKENNSRDQRGGEERG